VESFHFDVPCIIRSSDSRIRQLSRFTFCSFKRYTKNCLWRAKAEPSTNSHGYIDAQGMRRIWIFWIQQKRVGCCAIANLGAANSFPDTANSSTVKRSDKNAKRSGKMRCSLPHSSFFSTPIALYEVCGKGVL